MLIHNEALADEICALNAIYGDGTIDSTFSDTDHTTISLHFAGLDYAFLLHISHTYPSSNSRVLGVDDLFQSRQVAAQQNIAYFQACLLSVHRPDDVCLYDVVEEFRPIIEIQRECFQVGAGEEGDDSRQKLAEEKSMMLRNLAIRISQGATISSRGLSDVVAPVGDCAVCMEPFFRVDMANLACSHSYCLECLHEGLTSTYQQREELRCCGTSIPISIVRDLGGLDDEFLGIYMAWLKERHASNPLYCPYEHCNQFIPHLYVQEGAVKCPSCKKRLCVGCKKKEHRGMCKTDVKLAAMLKANHWQFCPHCSHLVERTYGCNHMDCVCGSRFCYRCGKKNCQCGTYEAVDYG